MTFQPDRKEDRPLTPPRLDPTTAERLEEIWRRAYRADSQEDLLRLYADWAETYDQDHRAVGFFGDKLAAATLSRYVPNPEVAAVLDAGCGTGAAGEALYEAGYRNLTGIDLSPAMLERARAKGVYRHLAVADLDLPLDDFPSHHFDAAILVGVFSYGQAPAHALDEIVRVVKPGGVIVFTLRVDFFEEDAMGVRSKMEEHERTYAWKQLEVSEPAQYLPRKDPAALFKVFSFRALETKIPPVDEDFAEVVREAFSADSRVKRIDHSFIWNTTASRLYDRYTECPEYYLTDCEVEILERNAGEILGDDRLVVELGCGSARKISCLLDAAVTDGEGVDAIYTPVDVSEGALEATRAEIEAKYTGAVEVLPRCGRFDDVLASIPRRGKLIVFFGGSLGNLETLADTVDFLRMVRDRMTATDRLVVGIDLYKDPEVLRRAYEAGEANRSFFLNMLRRINDELGANLDLGVFRQASPIEPDRTQEGLEAYCVQLRLVTEEPQEVYFSRLHMDAHLDAGDAVQIGTSRKFRSDDIARLAELAGLRLRRQWFDERRYFSLNELVRSGGAS